MIGQLFPVIRSHCLKLVEPLLKVDKGPLIGATVTFHRRNTWVLGYNMGKADLTNLFIEGQKVSLEAIAITPDDRKKYPGPEWFRSFSEWKD